MLTRFALVLLVALAPLASHADDYRCEDRDYLASILNNLNTRCGGATCTALGIKGSTVQSAIDECAHTYARVTCAQSVTCTDGAPVCDSLGIKGSSVGGAVNECARTYARVTCAQSVTCQNSPVCQSLGIKGSSLEEAITECARTYARVTCAQNASCP